MADKRESFRARRVAFGGRRLPRLCLAATLATLLCAAGAAHAQDAGLKNGAASLAAGKYSDAVRQLSATVNSDNASPGDAAKALYLRGIAYRKIGEPARAAADLGAAIWLGLPEPDRVKALVNRGLAFRAAGLSQQAEAEIASARKIGGSSAVEKLIAEGGGSVEGAASVTAFSTEVRPEGRASASNERSRWFPSFGRGSETEAPSSQPEPTPTRTASASPQWSTTTSKPGETAAPAAPAAASGAWDTSVAGAEQPSSASSGGNRLTRWFGSRTESSPAAPEPQAAPTTQTAAVSPQPSPPPAAPSAAAASSSWSTTTDGATAEAGGGESKRSWRIFGRTAEAEPAAQAAAAQPSASGGGFQLQLANSRSVEEAKALWKQVSQSQGLQGVSPAIEKVDIGDFGTFYSLKIGPFPDKAQSVKVCNALKRNGIDCLPVTL
jgi:tetratricopeptide (TPR) repeat protein